MQQTPHSPRPSRGSIARGGGGSGSVLVRDLGPQGRLNLHQQASRHAGHRGDGFFELPHISPLDLPGPTAPQAVLVPEGALPVANANGMRIVNERTYLDLESGQTVMVVLDPVTGAYQQRAPYELAASGPPLQRVVGTSTWTATAPAARATVQPGPAPVTQRGRLDPSWDLRRYDVRHGGTTSVHPLPGKHGFMIQGQPYYVDAQFALDDYKRGRSEIHLLNASNQLVRCGTIAEDGVIQIRGNPVSTYIGIGPVISRAEFDSVRSKWRLRADVQGGADIYLDTGGRLGSWVPELRLDSIGPVIAAARKVLGYTGVSSDIGVGYMSTMDKQTYCYMRQYARQMVAFDNPHIRTARALAQDRLIDQHIWVHGYPYDRLMQGVSAKAEDRALPIGVAQFDPFQGMATYSARREGGFNVEAIRGNDQLHYPQRRRTQDEQQLFDHWSSLSIDDTGLRGAANEQMYRAMLTNDGYQVIPGGTYGGGQHGFDVVLRGPAGDVYLLEIKHVSSDSNNRLSTVHMARVSSNFQMEDGWIRNVLRKSDAGGAEAGRVVQDALERQRLFKLIGATSPAGKMVLFKIDMSPVR